MSVAPAVAVAVVFVWLGMVLAISFIEAPLKFRAPGVTLQIGLGIGRLVFRALNACELSLAAIVVACFAGPRCLRCGRGSPGGPTLCSPVARGRAHAAIASTSAWKSSRWPRYSSRVSHCLRRETIARCGWDCTPLASVRARPAPSSTPLRPPPNGLDSRRCGRASTS